jgi:endonuclease YncB( thermonuclease family)
MKTNKIMADSEELIKNCGAEKFNLCGIDTLALVVSCHDGDTLTVVLPFLGKYFKFVVRLAGINAPEINSKDEAVQKLAITSRNRLLELIGLPTTEIEKLTLKKASVDKCLKHHQPIVYLSCGKFGKYGRVLGVVKTKAGDIENVCDILLREGLASKY